MKKISVSILNILKPLNHKIDAYVRFSAKIWSENFSLIAKKSDFFFR